MEHILNCRPPDGGVGDERGILLPDRRGALPQDFDRLLQLPLFTLEGTDPLQNSVPVHSGALHRALEGKHLLGLLAAPKEVPEFLHPLFLLQEGGQLFPGLIQIIQQTVSRLALCFLSAHRHPLIFLQADLCPEQAALFVHLVDNPGQDTEQAGMIDGDGGYLLWEKKLPQEHLRFPDLVFVLLLQQRLCRLQPQLKVLMPPVVVEFSQDHAAFIALRTQKPLEFSLGEHDDPPELVGIKAKNLLYFSGDIILVFPSPAVCNGVPVF